MSQLQVHSIEVTNPLSILRKLLLKGVDFLSSSGVLGKLRGTIRVVSRTLTKCSYAILAKPLYASTEEVASNHSHGHMVIATLSKS
jgi:hypothetical protein